MPKPKKTWTEKLNDSKDLPKIEPIDESKMKKWGTGRFVIPAPLEVDAVMKTIRKGKLITINEIRNYLAEKHEVEVGCPLTTGIFAWVAAHAANEAEEAGRKRITPYWRTLKAGGELNPKYPGGVENLKHRLEAEGHSVIQRGKRWLVEEFEKKLAALS